MKLEIWRSRYFKQIFSILSLSTFLLLFVALTVLYYTFSYSTHSYLNTVNSQFIENTLSTVYYQIDTAYKNILNAYTSSNGVILMASKNTSAVSELAAMKEIDYFLSQNQVLHSVYFYSAQSQKVYMFGEELSQSSIDTFFDTQARENILTGVPTDALLTPRTVSRTSYDPSLCNILTSYYKIQNGDVLVVNFDTEKVFSAFHSDPAVYRDAPMNYFIYYGHATLLYSNVYYPQLVQTDSVDILSLLQQENWSTTFKHHFANEQFQFHIFSDDTYDFQIVCGIREQDLSASFSIYKIIFVSIILIGIIITLFTSLQISARLYSPINKIKHLVQNPKNNSNTKNEIESITSSIEDTSLKLNQLFEYKEKSISVSQALFVKEQLLYNKYSDEQFFEKCVQQELPFSSSDSFVLFYTKWDISQSQPEFLKDQNLLCYALGNIFCEIMGTQFSNIQQVPLESSAMMFLCKVGQWSSEDCVNGLKKIQTAFLQHFELNLSFFISDILTKPHQFFQKANLLSEISFYSYFYNNNCILYERDFNIDAFSSELPVLPDIAELEKALRASDQALCREIMDTYFDSLPLHTRESVYASVNLLASKLITLFKKLQSSSPAFPAINYHLFFRQVTQSASILETKQEIFKTFSSIFDFLSDPDNNTDSLLIEEIICYMKENYSDYNLSSKSIALKHHISVPYLNRIFKQKTGDIFASYLKQMRLEHACDLLINTNMSVESVAKKVGFENTKYFYTLFKDQYGVSPNNYRISKSLASNSPNQP